MHFSGGVSCAADPFDAVSPLPDNDLQKARWYFQHEDFEEALVLLQRLRESSPGSSEIAYLLGLTYKRLQQFPDAAAHLEAAATLEPPIKNASIELTDVLYQTEQLEDAKKWAEYAEKDDKLRAQALFFKGLILLKEGNDPRAALQSLETAELLDPSLSQSISYQKAMANVQLKNYKEARHILSEVVTRAPGTDLAGFANEYISVLTRTEDARRPFHGSFGYTLQYDDNVVYRPDDDRLAQSVDTQDDWKHVLSAQGDYLFRAGDSFGVKAGYSLYGSRHNDIGFYDMLSVDLPVQPILYLEKATVAFPMHYNFVTVNERTYLSTVGLSNVINYMLSPEVMLQTQLQFNDKNYRWAVSRPDDEKKGEEYLAGAGIFRFFGKNRQGFVNLRYAFNYEDAKGHNWDYTGNRITFTSVVPFAEKYKWHFVTDYFREDFKGVNTTYDKKRTDNVITVSNLLSYQIMKNTDVQLQHTYVYDGASIGVYKYKKNVYGVGAKYQF